MEDPLEDARDLLTLLAYFDSHTVSENLFKAYCNHMSRANFQTGNYKSFSDSRVRNETRRHQLQASPGAFLARHIGKWDIGEILSTQHKLSESEELHRRVITFERGFR